MFEMKPLGCDPQRLKGLSEKLIVSHYENNYGGAVKRLNQIDEHLQSIDIATAPGFLINGLKREELIATNSMILHEIYFGGLGTTSAPASSPKRSHATSAAAEQWARTVFGHGQSAGRWLGLGPAQLLPAQRAAGEPVGGRPHHHHRRWHSRPRTRHVRALISHRLWR